jgi:hypothetical protein
MKVDLWESGEIIKYLAFGDLEFLIQCITLTEQFDIGGYRNVSCYSEKSIFSQNADKETEEKTMVYIERERL